MAKGSEEKLRRQLEILKAQIKSNPIQVAATTTKPDYTKQTINQITKEGNNKPSRTPQNVSYELNYKKIRTELTKTFIFSTLMLVLLFTLYLTESKWLSLIKFI